MLWAKYYVHIIMHKSRYWLRLCFVPFADCFFRCSELHFAQADYLQALEMDPDDQAVKTRLSIVYNEFGILDYYDRHYLEAIEHLTAAIRFNPTIAGYFLSRARARYMIEVRTGDWDRTWEHFRWWSGCCCCFCCGAKLIWSSESRFS